MLLLACVLAVPVGAAAQEARGTIIVRMRPGLDPKSAAGLVSDVARRLGGAAAVRSVVPERRQSPLMSASGLDRYYVVDAGAVGSGRMISALRSEPAVEEAFPNQIYRIHYTPVDSLYSEQWAPRVMNAERAWNVTPGDSSVLVAVIDTGIDFDHPDLAGAFRVNVAEDLNRNGRFDPWPFNESRGGVTGDIDLLDQDRNGYADDVIGYDFVDEVTASVGDWNGRDPVPYDFRPGDANDHGTNVAGIISARHNSFGVAGLAPGARLLAVRALDGTGDGEDDDMAAALIYAADQGASVINMSFGDAYYSPLMRDAIRYAYAKGAVLVASSGNDGGLYRHFPSSYPEVISVGAVDRNDLRTTFSTTGPQLSISAPGAEIATLSQRGRYKKEFNGTSAAAPHVSGTAALIRSLHPSWTPDEVRTAMELTARDLNVRGWDNDYGAGRVDAGAALAMPGPASVAILNPDVEAAFSRDTAVTVIGSAMAPFLESWQLFYGLSETPTRWTALGEPQTHGRVIDSLGRFATAGIPDTVVTLRLLLRLTDGRETERRVVLTIDRSRPAIQSPGPVIENVWRFNERAVSVTFRTDDRARSTLMLRRADLPGAIYRAVEFEPTHTGTTRSHFYILTGDELEREIPYEIYIVVRNAAGDTAMYGSPEAPVRIVRRGEAFPVTSFSDDITPYTLPYGFPLNETATFFNDGQKNIAINRFENDGFGDLEIYSFDGSRFTRRDTTPVWAPRGFGDSDGDGLLEVLGQDGGRGIVMEQPAPGTSPLRSVMWADTTSGDAYVNGFFDFDGDGRDELYAHSGEEANPYYYVSRWNGSRYDEVAKLMNTTPYPPQAPFNRFGNSEGVTGDFDGDGLPELLVADNDNDFLIFERGADGGFREVWRNENPGSEGSPLFAAADLDGDGADEIIIAYRTRTGLNADREYEPPFWTVRVYRRFDDGTETLLWSDRFTNVRFSIDLRSTVGGFDLDGRPGEDVVLSLYPGLYVLTWDAAAKTLVPAWWRDGVLNYKLMAHDFNGDGLTELGLGIGDSIRFYQIATDRRAPAAPTALDGWGTSDSTVHLEWNPVPGADYYTIYRARLGDDPRVTFDSVAIVTGTSIRDTGFRKDQIVVRGSGPNGRNDTLRWLPGTLYSYIVTARDLSLELQESGLSNSALAYTHDPARIVSITPADQRSFVVAFDFLLREEIYRAGAFEIREAISGAEVSVSSIETVDDFSLLVTLNDDHDGDSITVRATLLLRDRFRSPADTTLTVGARLPERESPGERFIATRGTSLAPRTIAVDFNAPVDPQEATNPAIYRLDPPGTVLSATVDPADPSRVLLTVPAEYPLGALGLRYAVEIKELRAADGRLINNGAGSVVGFTIEADDLADVRVYPHPFSLSRDGVATFAGITRTANVEIFTQSGMMVRELPVVNSAGGTEWNGEDRRGERVPTGIYLYRVTGTNADGSTFESDLRKIAVVP